MRFAAATVFLSALTLVGAGGCGSGSLQHAGTGGVAGTGTGGGQAGSSGAGNTGGGDAGSGGPGGFAGSGAGGGGGSEGWLGTGGGGGVGATGGWAGGGTGGYAGPVGPCTDGTSICVGNSLYVCGSTSGAWTHQKDCDFRSPHCVTSGSQATCQCDPGATFCADGFTESRCNGNGTFDLYPCGRLERCGPLRCSTSCSVLSPDSCIDVTTIRTCVDGTITAVPCGPALVCFNGECVPNNT